MFGSISLGKLFGIDLFVHGTFWLLPLFVAFSGLLSSGPLGAAFDVIVIFAVFGCIALHEAGHALAARAFGIGTRDITLYPMGGIARLDRIPERPGREIAIALAGPAVNIAIAVGIAAAAILGEIALPGLWTSADVCLVELFLSRLLAANLFLALFNLIPAFPMDGGRVLRAVLSLGFSRLAATQAAVGVGTVLAGLGFFYGLLAGMPSLLLVSVVIFFLGRAELAAVRMEEARKRWEEYFYRRYLEV
jgi:Zn-dependent protease